jgi:hypothetical protein
MQLRHVVPDPHAMLLDATHVLPEQQKFVPQGVANVHVPVQPPLAHVGVAPLQAVQAPPACPHAALVPPGTQLVPSQHPP